MAFVTKTWKDRISEYPTRRILTKTDGSTEFVTVARSEGSISQDGDAFSAENMNDLEKRIDNAITELKNSVADGKASVASAITEKGVPTAQDATFSELAENIAMISSGGTAELTGIPINVSHGYGSTTATSSFEVSDGGTYLIIATVAELNPSDSYDGIDLVKFTSNGASVGTLLNENRINAPGINQGSELRKGYYYIAQGNQKIEISIKAHTFSNPNQASYGMAAYAEILAFKID